MHSKSTHSHRLPGSKSARSVRNSRQLDLFQNLWHPPSGVKVPTPERTSIPPNTGTARDSNQKEDLRTETGAIAVEYVRHPRARRYRLIFRRNGTARCTIPRGGTLREAKSFVAQQENWLTQRMRAFRERETAKQTQSAPSTVFIFGIEYTLPTADPSEAGTWVELGEFRFMWMPQHGSMAEQIERQLRIAAIERMPARLMELARIHGLEPRVRRISIRSQRTRWGSCSRRGTISLNWRLMQLPPMVSDYILMHELAHLLHLNHSPKFWTEVERMCPTFRESEAWLRKNGRWII